MHEDDVVGRELAQVASRARHLEPPAVGLRADGADLERHLAAGDLQAALAERDDERAGAGAVSPTSATRRGFRRKSRILAPRPTRCASETGGFRVRGLPEPRVVPTYPLD